MVERMVHKAESRRLSMNDNLEILIRNHCIVCIVFIRTYCFAMKKIEVLSYISLL